MLKPEELEKVEFSVSFRGYNSDQVDKYIDDVVETVSKLSQKCEEYEKLCAEQKRTIAKLESERSGKSFSSGADISLNDAARNEYDMYRAKIEKLRQAVHAFKSEAFSLFQKQIIEIQEFDFDEENFDEVKQFAPVTETKDEVAFEKGDEPEAIAEVPSSEAVKTDVAAVDEVKEEFPSVSEPVLVQNEKLDEIESLIDELSETASSSVSAETSEDTLESLINDLSGTVSDESLQETDKISGVKSADGKSVVSSPNSSVFNSMFITDIDGE